VAAPAVRFENIVKRFPGAVALNGVSLEVAAGSVHALCGENGAGKSTLGRVLAGIHRPDEGTVFLHGEPVELDNPRDALLAGVGMVHQEGAACERLTVAENLCLGALPARAGFVQWGEMARRARAILAEVGADLDVTRALGELSVAQQQLVQIAAAVGSGARVIVFDEPTSSLGHAEVERLFDLIGRLKVRGVTCIYVSHRMPEVFKLCDRVSVLRDGAHVATRDIAGLTDAELTELMIGRKVSEYFPAHAAAAPGPELLRVEALTRPGAFEDISFALRAGEVLGLAGLVGAGRSELARALFGIEPAASGTTTVKGRVVTIRTPRDAIALGIGLVPEDRKRQALVALESATHNVSLPILKRLASLSWLRRREEQAVAQDYCGRLQVRAGDLGAPVAGLSGGNQQKVVLARWLAARSSILILDEPTRGVDVGAKAEIHMLIAQLAEQGHGVLLISSELPEILRLASRILVLRGGRLAGEVPGGQATQGGLLRLMAGLGEGEVRIAG